METQVLETNTVYTMVSHNSLLFGVWYAIYYTMDLSESVENAIFCNNDFEATKKHFTLLIEEYEQFASYMEEYKQESDMEEYEQESDYQSEKNAEMANEISLYGCRF